MPVDPKLRTLNIDVPAQPEALVKLSLLLAEDDVDLPKLGRLVEGDMSLAAAVMRAVNSSLYGVKGRVQSVQQAVMYLGTREVAAVTFEFGLRAVFPAAPELEEVWQRATVRGLLMGRIGQALGVDPWGAHSAGLFEECGKAVLFKHSQEVYRDMLARAANDTELVEREFEAFGVSHDALGASLCESWGLGNAAVASVRHHVRVNALRQLPAQAPRRAICALSALANALMTDPDTLDEVAQSVAPQAMLDQTLVLRGARKVQAMIEDAALRDNQR